MDPLTHTLVGGCLARTALGRRSALAPAALLIGANLPDVDVLTYLRGADFALGARRGWTHGVLAAAVMPLLLTGALLAWDRWVRRGRSPTARPRDLLAVAYVGVLSHPLLDWLNNYGVRLLMPFDDRWFYGDAVFIIDPWLWLVLGGTLFLCCSRSSFTVAAWLAAAALTSVPVLGIDAVPGAGKVVWVAGLLLLAAIRLVAPPRGPGEGRARIGLAIAAVYLVWMVGAARVSPPIVLRALEREGVTAVRDLMVAPVPADPFRSVVVADTGAVYRFGSFDWLAGGRLILDPRKIDKLPDSAVVEAALRAPHVQGARVWMRFPFAEVEPHADGFTVYLLDARYVRQRSRGFGTAVIELDRDLRVLPPGGDRATE